MFFILCQGTLTGPIFFYRENHHRLQTEEKEKEGATLKTGTGADGKLSCLLPSNVLD